MTASGRVVFSKMEEVVFGRPAAEALSELVERQGANRVFLMVSGTRLPPFSSAPMAAVTASGLTFMP